jgi:hypothetical protein
LTKRQAAGKQNILRFSAHAQTMPERRRLAQLSSDEGKAKPLEPGMVAFDGRIFAS